MYVLQVQEITANLRGVEKWPVKINKIKNGWQQQQHKKWPSATVHIAKQSNAF